jgi:hypothetical protein
MRAAALFSRMPVDCLGPGPRRVVWSAVRLLLGQPQAAGLALDLRPLLVGAPSPLARLLRQAFLADLLFQLPELALERPLALALGFLLLPAPSLPADLPHHSGMATAYTTSDPAVNPTTTPNGEFKNTRHSSDMAVTLDRLG